MHGMKNKFLRPLAVLTSLASVGGIMCSKAAMSDDGADVLTGGVVYGDVRLRYEAVEDESEKKDADGLTLGTHLGFRSGEIYGFSGVIELEDSRTVAGWNNYNNTNGIGIDYSVIPDPETTELDQGFLQYEAGGIKAKLGRQILTFDNHRFVGHVGWRQDRQTFDGVSVDYAFGGLKASYSFLGQRNRIFGEEKDIHSDDHLVNLAYKAPIGTLVAYAYLLEEDSDLALAYDTYGVRFTGSKASEASTYLFSVEYAAQEKTSNAGIKLDSSYLGLEGGIVVRGVTAKVGYEALGSDDGHYGFSTPLATLHKFNGWADQFLATPDQGLVDRYASVSGTLGRGTLAFVYHDFSADSDAESTSDLGGEIDISYTVKFRKRITGGIKYASYAAGDSTTVGGKVKTYEDTQKLWVWIGAKF